MPSSPLRRRLGLVLPILLAIVLLWAPFGSRMIGVLEEWDMLGNFSTSGLFYVIDSTTPLSVSLMRPLLALSPAVAMRLTPDSFMAWHGMLALSLFVKAWASALLGRSLTGSARWGLVLGLLVLVYPADTMQLSFRSLHINIALAGALLAAAMVVLAWDSPRRLSAAVLTACAMVLLGGCILMYEAAITMFPVPFLVVLARDGFRRTMALLRAKAGITFAWFAVVALYGAYAIVVSRGGSHYYQQSIADGSGFLYFVRERLPKLFSVGLPRAMVEGWVDAWRMVRSEFTGFGYLLAATAACVVSIGLAPSASAAVRGRAGADAARIARMFVIGLVLAACGYAPYLLSNAHIHISQRTYLYAAPGAALAFLALLMGLRSAGRMVVAGVFAVLLALGLGAQLYQFHHYILLGETQRVALRNIVENLDGRRLDGGKVLLVLDHSNRFAHTWLLRDNLGWALSYLYDMPVPNVEICLMPGGLWQRQDIVRRTGTCREEAEKWVLEPPRPLDGIAVADLMLPQRQVLPKSQTVVLEIGVDGKSVAAPELSAHRLELLTGSSHMAKRYRNILAREPYAPRFGLFADPRRVPDRYRWDFGTWWSLEVPTHGSGWREADWEGSGLGRYATAWKNGERARLLFDLAPAAVPYVLTGRFDAILNDEIGASIGIQLNGTVLPIRWTSPGFFEADVPPQLLRSGVNSIDFSSRTDPTHHDLSARLDWFDIQPR